MEFNIDKLINVVKERPAIWDTHNKLYTKNNKLQAWKEIVDIIDREDNDLNIHPLKLGPLIQKRWKNLRDAHVKQMKKIQENPGGDVAKNYRLLKRLSFLNRVISTGGRNINVTTDTEADTWEGTEGNEEEYEHLPIATRSRVRVEMDASEDNDVIEGPEEIDLEKLVDAETLQIIHTDPLETIMDNSVEPPPNKKRKIKCESEKYASNDESHTKHQMEREECQVFGELVAVKLRKLDSRTRAYVQHIINNTLFKAEMGLIKHVNSD